MEAEQESFLICGFSWAGQRMTGRRDTEPKTDRGRKENKGTDRDVPLTLTHEQLVCMNVNYILTPRIAVSHLLSPVHNQVHNQALVSVQQIAKLGF